MILGVVSSLRNFHWTTQRRGIFEADVLLRPKNNVTSVNTKNTAWNKVMMVVVVGSLLSLKITT